MQDKVVLVTGASGGIGRAICVACAKKGAKVVVNYNNNYEGAKQTMEECLALGSEAICIKANVSVESECEKLFAQIIEKFATLDILINNAGVTKDGLIIKMSAEDFDKVIDTNLKGAFFCMKNASKIMMKKRYGRIVSISSVVGVHGNAGQVNYSASKAGIIGMSKSLAKELASRNICVNVVAPGFIQTEMTSNLSDKVKENLLNQIPTKSLGQVEDVANAVVFLASENSRYITGIVLGVDGGMGM